MPPPCWSCPQGHFVTPYRYRAYLVLYSFRIVLWLLTKCLAVCQNKRNLSRRAIVPKGRNTSLHTVLKSFRVLVVSRRRRRVLSCRILVVARLVIAWVARAIVRVPRCLRVSVFASRANAVADLRSREDQQGAVSS
jgi:hypothetical protein